MVRSALRLFSDVRALEIGESPLDASVKLREIIGASEFWKARARLLLAGAMVASIFSPDAHAIDPTAEQSRRVAAASQLGGASDGGFGERVSPYTGQTIFEVTDVSIPGNGSLPVEFRRSFTVEDREVDLGRLGGIGDWDVSVPMISTVVSGAYGWTVGGPSPNARCSSLTPPRNPSAGAFADSDMWSGYHVEIPGVGKEELLSNSVSGVPRPSGNLAYPWRTESGMQFSCLPATQNGLAGESFIGLDREGTRYWFNWATSRAERAITNPIGGSGAGSLMTRQRVFLLATRVEDRHGNWVQYSYGASGLTGITSSDGRTISVAYGANGRVSTVQSHGRVWSFHYSGPALAKVVLPDGKEWSYTSTGALAVVRTNSPPEAFGYCTPHLLDDGSFTYQVTNPFGLVGRFNFTHQRRYRGGVPLLCETYVIVRPTDPPANSDAGIRLKELLNNITIDITTGKISGSWLDQVTSAINEKAEHDREVMRQAIENFFNPVLYERVRIPGYFDVFALASKQVSGPALPVAEWRFEWQPDFVPSYCDLMFPDPANCSEDSEFTVVQVITNPDGTKLRRYLGAGYARNEGDLIREQVVSQNGEVLSEINFEYERIARVAKPVQSTDWSAGEARALVSRSVTLGDTIFQTVYGGFDNHQQPTVVEESRVGDSASRRITRTTYLNDLGHWVIGLPVQVTVDGVPGVVQQTEYHGTSRLPVVVRGQSSTMQGRLQQQFSYHSNGLPATVTDANGNVTTLSNYYRGVPRSITFADASAISATVGSFGEILSVTDQLQNTTSYTYDLGGRITRVDYPVEADGSTWHPVVSSLTRNAAADATLGLPAGVWRHRTTRGDYRKDLYLDAMMRPILEREEDVDDFQTVRLSSSSYDTMGRRVFSSYPRSLAEFSGLASLTLGVRTQFDPLDRPVQTRVDSEHGPLLTTVEYLAGFRRRTTDPRGNQVVEDFLARGAPTYDMQTLITEPEGRVTAIQRDVMDRVVSISRSGLERSWIYDGFGLLCKQIEPETGATVSSWDAAGNLEWIARGTDLDGDTCDRHLAPETLRVAWQYDQLNRVIAVNYPDGVTPSESYTYRANGSLLRATRELRNAAGSVVRNEATWTYDYNRRGLIVREHVERPGIGQYAFRWTHDAHGHVATYRDPWTEVLPSFGLTLDFAPNALGQPTRAGNFAINATYFPNGALKSFTYGNGAVYTAALNQRGMLDRAQVARSGAMIVDDSYDYDAVGNVVALTDTVTPNGTRTMTYDGVNRLLTASYGNGTEEAFTYDNLDNIRTWRENTQTRTFNYDGRNQLSSVAVPGPLTLATYAYNTAGEQTSRTPVYPISSTAQVRTFDMAGRLARVTGLSDTRYSGGEVRYEYDVHGRRVTQWRDRAQHTFGTPDVRVSYYTFDGVLRGEADNFSGKYGSTDYVYLGSTLVAKSFISWTNTTPRTTTYMHTDMLGSTIAETNQAGAVVRRERHLSYGAPMDGVMDDTIGYALHQQDPATGLIQMQQRYFDDGVGRFLAPDPVGALADPVRHFSRYSYANNSPYGYLDRDGRSSVPAVSTEPRRDSEQRAFVPREGNLHEGRRYGLFPEYAQNPLMQKIFDLAMDGNNMSSNGKEHHAYGGIVGGEIVFQQLRAGRDSTINTALLRAMALDFAEQYPDAEVAYSFHTHGSDRGNPGAFENASGEDRAFWSRNRIVGPVLGFLSTPRGLLLMYDPATSATVQIGRVRPVPRRPGR